MDTWILPRWISADRCQRDQVRSITIESTPLPSHLPTAESDATHVAASASRCAGMAGRKLHSAGQNDLLDGPSIEVSGRWSDRLDQRQCGWTRVLPRQSYRRAICSRRLIDDIAALDRHRAIHPRRRLVGVRRVRPVVGGGFPCALPSAIEREKERTHHLESVTQR